MKHANASVASSAPNQSLRARRISVLLAIAGVLLAVLLHTLLGQISPNLLNPSVTGSDTFLLTGTTKDFLQTLEEDVTLYLVDSSGAVNGELYRFLLRYGEASERVKVSLLDPVKDADFFESCGFAEPPAESSVIVQSQKQVRLISYTDLFYYYNSYLDINMTPAEYQSSYASLSSDLESLLYFIETTTAYFDGDFCVTNAIRSVLQEKLLKVCVLTGATGASLPDAGLRKTVFAAGCEFESVSSVAALPSDCDLLLFHVPTTDLTADEAEALSAYLEQGGKLLLTTFYEYRELPRLREILRSYGMDFTDERDVVLEGDSFYVVSDSTETSPQCFYAQVDASHAATGEFKGKFLMYLAHAVQTDTVEGVTVTPWLKTTKQGGRTYYDEKTKEWITPEDTAVYTVGAIAQKDDSAIVWITSPYALTTAYDSYTGGANFSLLLSAIGWLGDAEVNTVNSSPTLIDSAQLTNIDFTKIVAWGVVLVLVLPLGTLGIGALACSVRKKRR